MAEPTAEQSRVRHIAEGGAGAADKEAEADIKLPERIGRAGEGDAEPRGEQAGEIEPSRTDPVERQPGDRRAEAGRQQRR